MSESASRPPRYAVGIDLGTTQSAMAFVDRKGAGRIEDIRIPQVVAPGVTEARDTLPSFLYEAAPGEVKAGAFNLPWSSDGQTRVAGWWARERGAAMPGRLVASAKSWLCHAGVDRTAPILPWHGAPEVNRLSPVDAAVHFLAHMRGAWNHAHPSHPLEHQDVVVTIPASFDEVARELTAEAAARAGLEQALLIEEPQAAFYAWMAEQPEGGSGSIPPGQLVLVCDIGGGTTDLTLIETVPDGDRGVSFRRIAVGDHLILGGDNLDLALAYHLEPRVAGGRKLDARQWGMLVRQCCAAKERLLGAEAPETMILSLPFGGSRIVGGSVQVELSRAEAIDVLVDGFLPMVPPDAEPSRTGSGFREFGLPYAADAGITRYLADFLRRQAGRMPDAVLLNGGFFESPVLRNRLMEVLASWCPTGHPPRVLANARLDRAVARGAAHYGLVRRGQGPRIHSGLPRAYYVGVANAEGRSGGVVCVAPAGLEEGEGVETPGARFEVLVRQPVEFQLVASTTRTTDQAGDRLEYDPAQVTPLPPMRTVLQTGKKAVRSRVPVGLYCRATEIGTFEIWCREQGGPRQWRLQFDLRARRPDGETAAAGAGDTLEEAVVSACGDAIRAALAGSAEALATLPRALESAAGIPRPDWPPQLLRRLWEDLMARREDRRASPAHESRWLNLAGFCLRPGFGRVLDDWRVEEIWKLYSQGVQNPRNELCRAEWWILWRRVAGGLDDGRQLALAEPLLGRLKAHRGTFGCGGHESAEIWRLLACLERLPLDIRRSLGERLRDRIARKGWGSDHGSASWALARLASRVPFYGSLQGVIEPEQVAQWLPALLAASSPSTENLFQVALMVRRTGDRYRDVDDGIRAQVMPWLRKHHAADHLLELVEQGGELDSREQVQASGDTLPLGLRWLGP